jgi:hypothetical protein
MADLFSSNGVTLKVDASKEYDAGITDEIDKAIRHMKPVILRMAEKSAELQRATGSDNFEIVRQMDENTQRPRFYVVPKNNKGIHEELSKAVLLKAALGMKGK